MVRLFVENIAQRLRELRDRRAEAKRGTVNLIARLAAIIGAKE